MTPKPKAEIKPSQVNHLRIDRDHAGRRVDNVLTALLRDVPKSRIYRMLRKGEVRLNGRRIGPEERVQEDDLLRIPPLRLTPRPGNPPIVGHSVDFLEHQILHEDRDLIVLNKPAGMAVHGGSGLRFGVIEALRHLRSDLPYLELVHRLDRDTSGCLMVAKKPAALRRLHELLRQGGVKKHYLTLARGQWSGGERVIEERLLKNVQRGGERVVRVHAGGKEAVTRFRLRRQYAGACLLDVDLGTGRTHQIRVHAAHAGFPVAGDGKYGDPGFNKDMRRFGLRRLFLHAARLSVAAGEGKAGFSAEAPLPDDLSTVLSSLDRQPPLTAGFD